MINKVLIATLTSACIGMPAYALNWSVDIDDSVRDNKAEIVAVKEANEREIAVQKERYDEQKARLMRIESILMEMQR